MFVDGQVVTINCMIYLIVFLFKQFFDFIAGIEFT